MAVKLPRAFNAMIAAPMKLYNFRTPMFPVHDRTKCYGARCVLCDAELVIAGLSCEKLIFSIKVRKEFLAATECNNLSYFKH
jgi:hypothetical protein